MNAVEIPLAGGRVALVDESDYPVVAERSWHCVLLGGGRPGHTAKPYVAGCWRRGTSLVLLHRFLLGAPRGSLVDHVNGNGLDNRRSNLRFCTHTENMQNQRAIKGIVPFKGVHPSGQPSASQAYRSLITVDRKRILVGYFPTPEEAAAAYDAAAVKYFGALAKTNQQLGLLPRPSNSEEGGKWLHTKSVSLP